MSNLVVSRAEISPARLRLLNFMRNRSNLAVDMPVVRNITENNKIFIYNIPTNLKIRQFETLLFLAACLRFVNYFSYCLIKDQILLPFRIFICASTNYSDYKYFIDEEALRETLHHHSTVHSISLLQSRNYSRVMGLLVSS